MPTNKLVDLANFRKKYFNHLEETRGERKRKQIEQELALQQCSNSR